MFALPAYLSPLNITIFFSFPGIGEPDLYSLGRNVVAGSALVEVQERQRFQ